MYSGLTTHIPLVIRFQVKASAARGKKILAAATVVNDLMKLRRFTKILLACRTNRPARYLLRCRPFGYV